ncbi:MAG: GAF domain-containing protein [Anaerolineales bacterium]|nr:GAF domain-containing protein [Anaerolineales bacterium]
MKVKITTIRVRLLIGFVLMAALSAIFISAGSIVIGYLNGQEQTRNRLDSVALSKEVQISAWTDGLQNELVAILPEKYITDRATIVLALAREHEYYSIINSAVRERLRFLVTQSPEIEELFLVDLDGQVVLSTDAASERMDTGDQLFFRQGLKGPFTQLPFEMGKTPVLSDAEVAVFIARPVLTAAGQTFGILAGRVGTEPLRQILADQTGLGDGGKSYLVDQMYTLLTASNLGAARPDHLIGQSEGIDAILDNKTHSSGSYADYRGIQVMGVSRWLPELQAALLVEQDQSEVFRSVFTSLGVNLAITLLIVLLAVAISSYISKSIATPLVDLADTATRIAAGDFACQTEVFRDDEVGVVARAFISMTQQLRDLINSLEQRVAERTQALQNANRSLERQTVQLETSAQVSREITSILEIDQLLNRVVTLIGNAFNYDYVHIYLLNQEGTQLRHRAGNMEDGPQLRILPVAGEGLNCEALRENKAVQVDHVAQDDHYLIDENMPDTQSELVLPLRVGDRVIGTLDVQSRQIAAFSESDGLVLQSLGDQIAIAIENARLYNRSQELAVMEERTRLARDLHDSVTQSLYGLVVFAGAGQQVVESGKADLAKGHLARMEQAAQQALKEMRLLVYELRPPVLEEEGLVGALRQRLEAVEDRTGVTVDLQVHGVVDLPAPVEEGLFRIAQEALNNIIKHAAATSVTVQIHADDGGIELTIADDGVGLNAASDTGGMGLTSMRERAQELDASLTIHSAPGEGTRVSVRKAK